MKANSTPAHPTVGADPEMYAEIEYRSTPAGEAAEIGSLAGELARAYQQQTAFYREHMDLSPAEADLRASGRDAAPHKADAELARIRASPPESVSWFELQRLADLDPDEALGQWEAIKVQARDELGCGHRTAQALEWDGRPWDRARFLAIRDSLRGEDASQNGIEAALIDMAAEAFSTWLALTEQATMLMSTEASVERTELAEHQRWKPPHQVTAEYIERVTHRAEQAHQRFLRTIKMLNDVRRVNQTIHVGHAAQVNVGWQQLNAAGPPKDHVGHQDLPKSTAPANRRADDAPADAAPNEREA